MWAPRPHPLPQPLQRVPTSFASSGSLVLEDCRPEAQERSTGKEAHTARIPGHHLLRTWSSRLELCSLSGHAGRGSHPVPHTARHPGTRGCIVRPCGRVRLRHFPRDLHRRSPPVAPTLPRTTLWYQPAPTVPLWLLIVEGADGRRLFLPAICVHSARPSGNSKVESKRSRTKSHMPRKLQSWTDVAKATGHPDLWGLDPRILYDTSAALWKAGCRSLYQYLNAVAGIHPQPRVAAQCL